MPRPSGTFQFVADERSAHFPYERSSQNRRTTPAPFSMETPTTNTPPVANSFMNASSNARGGNIRCTDKITWIFLQIMLGINDPLAEATDTLVKGRIWDQALVCFREQLRINYNGIHPEISAFFESRFDVKKMLDQWNSMKQKYRELKAVNGMTGIGGTHPNLSWPFYDEVGQILANDHTIHPEVVMGTSINGEGPTITEIPRDEGRIRARMSNADKERTEASNASQRGLVHLPNQQINERILVPARRFTRLDTGNGQGTRARNNSSNLANVTGAGRRTRGAERVEERRSRGDSAGDFEGNTSTDIRTLISDAITQSNQNMKDNIELYHRLAEARLDRINEILNEQRRLDREERENYFRNRRNNSPR
ncbi:hypothetical protein BD770DRAFT_450061 [Pilaira anomala]|nr:hypothetical protein BD770DRAFT_450061 [Pilaira anomala]